MGSQRKEGAGGLGDDSGGRMRVRFLFATERVVLFYGEGVAVEGGEVNSCGGKATRGCQSPFHRILLRVETGKPCWKGCMEEGVREQ